MPDIKNDFMICNGRCAFPA